MWAIESINAAPLETAHNYTGSIPWVNTYTGSDTPFGETFYAGSGTYAGTTISLAGTEVEGNDSPGGPVSIATYQNFVGSNGPTVLSTTGVGSSIGTRSTQILSTATTTTGNLTRSGEIGEVSRVPVLTTYTGATGTVTGSTLTTTQTTTAAVALVASVNTVSYNSHGQGGDATHTYTGTSVVGSDLASGTGSSLTQSQIRLGVERIEVDFYSFAPNEWAWSFTFPVSAYDPAGGIFALTQIADEVAGNTWRPPVTTQTAATQDQDNAYFWEPMGFYLVVDTLTFTGTAITTTNATTYTGLNPSIHPQYDQVPTPLDTWTSSTGSVTTEITWSTEVPTATAPGNTVSSTTTLTTSEVTDESGGFLTRTAFALTSVLTSVGPQYGASQTYSVGVELVATTSVPTLAYDGDGNITGTQSAASSYFYPTTASYSGGGLAPAWTSYTTSPSPGETQTVYTVTGHNSYTNQAVIPTLAFGSFLGLATVLTPTYAPALRLGTDGKLDGVDGPESSWFYPWFSQVSANLWLPVTDAHARTASFADTTTAADPDTPDETFAVPDPDGSQRTFSYAWENLGGEWLCLISSTAQSPYDGRTTSGSTQFALQAGASDDASCYSTSQFSPYGGSRFEIAGREWAQNPESAILGSGLWAVTTQDDSGNQTTETLTVSNFLHATVASNAVIVFLPLPAWTMALGGNALPLFVGSKYDFEFNTINP